MRFAGLLLFLLALLIAGACGLSASNAPSERPEVGTADVTAPPIGGIWNTTLAGWRFGGAFSCDPNASPVTVILSDGVVDPCDPQIPDGARVVRVEIASTNAGIFTVAPTCSGSRTAGVFFGIFRAGLFNFEQAAQGTVSLLGGRDANDVLEGTFSVQFSSVLGPMSGGFRVEPLSSCP